MDAKPSKENGSDKPSSQSAGSIAQRSRLGRTLLFAGVFALLAMVFVPTPSGWYRLICDTSSGTRIAFVQLLVNVSFAALAGAIVANLSKRALYVIGACIAVVAAGLGVFALLVSAKDFANDARADERYADRLLQLKENQYGQRDRVKGAEDNLRSAAKKWRLAWRSDEAKRVKARADEVANMNAADRSRINQGLPKPTSTPDVNLGDFLAKHKPEAKKPAEFDSEADLTEHEQRQSTGPIRKALPVSPTPTAAKFPAIPHNDD